MPAGTKSDAGGDIFGLDRRVVAIVLVIAVVVVGAVAAMMFIGGGDEDSSQSNAQLDSVPQGADGVLYVDGNVTQDELMLQTLNDSLRAGWWALDPGKAPDIDVILQTLDTENIEYVNTTVFLQVPEEDQADYAGSIVNLGEGSSASDMVSLAEDQLGDLETTTYNGVDVNTVDVVEAAEDAEVEGVTDQIDLARLLREFVGVETTAWIATPDENTVILGSEEAASDAIDVYQGDAEPLDNDVREAHEKSNPGLVEATVRPDIIDQPLARVASVLSPDVAGALRLTGGNPELVSSSINIRDRDISTLTMDMMITMESQSGADDLFTLFEGFVDPTEVLDDRESIEDLEVKERAGGSQSGRHIHFEVPILPSQIADYIGAFVEEFGPEPEPLQLVPAEADRIVEVDGNLTSDGEWDDSTRELLTGAQEEGLIDDNQSPDEILETIQASEVPYNSATTFYNESRNDYQATFVDLDQASAEFIERQIRRPYRERTGGEEYEHREFQKGYRNLDVYELTELETELNITRALSGFVDQATTEWVVPVSNTSLLFGTEEAVKDAADIYRGAAAPADTDLHAAHNRTDGLITISSDVQDQPIHSYAGVLDANLGTALEDESASALAASYDLRDESAGTVTLDVQFATSDEASGDALAAALGETVDDTANEDAFSAPVSERAGLRQDGRFVALDIPYTPELLVADAGALEEEFGSILFPDGDD